MIQSVTYTKHIRILTYPGDRIEEIAKVAVETAVRSKKPVKFSFNQFEFEVDSTTSIKDVISLYFQKL